MAWILAIIFAAILLALLIPWLGWWPLFVVGGIVIVAAIIYHFWG